MYKVLDLFSGAGGMSLGFVDQKHFEIVGVIENNLNALETYQQNHKGKTLIVEHDIVHVNFDEFKKKIGDVDVIIGGPPCQGFSNANRQKTKFISMNNSLVKRYVDAVLTLRPKVFVMENVAMLKSDVHKFFNSSLDAEKVKRLGVEMKEEQFVIMNSNPDGVELLDLLKKEELVRKFALADETLNQIKVIKRYYANRGKLERYFCKYSKVIVNKLQQYSKLFSDDKIGEIVKRYLKSLIDAYVKMSADDKFKEDLDRFIEFVRAIGLMKELYDNKIIYTLESDGVRIVTKINTYTVYNYISRRFETEYKIQDSILNAIDYGVAQERRRFVLIGVRKDLCTAEFEIAVPQKNEEKVRTVRDVISDLEEYEPSTSLDAKPIDRRDFSKDQFVAKLQDKTTKIFNHVITDTRETALNRFKRISQGGNFHSLDESMKTDTYTDPTRTQNTIYLRLKYDEPCGTVVNVRKSMWIHPVKDRAISIREAARLQTFPDSYVFYGTKDSQYQQIGNAVPPILATAIAEQIYKMLKEIANG